MPVTRQQILGLPDSAKFWLSYLPAPDALNYDGRTVTVDYLPTEGVDCEDVCSGIGESYDVADTEDESEYKNCVDDCEDTRKEFKTSVEFDAESGKVKNAAVFIGCPYDDNGYLDESEINKLESKLNSAGFKCIPDRSAYVGSGCLSAIHAHEFTSATSNPDFVEEGPSVCWYHIKASDPKGSNGTIADLSEALDLQ